MAEVINCPFCGKENRPKDYYCRFCDGELSRPGGASFIDNTGFDEGEDHGGHDGDDSGGMEEDEFAELDYRPRSKAGCFVPGVVIMLILGIIAGGIFILTDWFGAVGMEEETEPPELEIPEDEPVDVVEEPEEEEPEPDPEEEEVEEPEPNGEDQPDYDQLEAALLNWLIGRVDDPTVILLHIDEAQDPEKFYDRYDLSEDNVIVYEVDSKDEEFVTVKFGPPFSEWSIRVVFIWDQVEWRFLREEEVR